MDLKRPSNVSPFPPDSSARGPHVCILGGGFGGLYTALALHRQLQHTPIPCHITLVEPADRFTFTPLLFELLTGELRPWQVAPQYRDLLAHTAIRLQQDWVESLSLVHRRIYLRHGAPLSYDYLVVALGSRQRTFAVPGIKAHAFAFATLDDAWKLERRLADLEQSAQAPIQVAIVGGGPSGVELACKLADRLGSQGHIHLLDRRAEILRDQPEPVRKAALRSIGRRAIRIHLETQVDAVDSHQIQYHQHQERKALAADLVIWAVGCSPRHWPSVEDVATTERGQCWVRPTLQLPEYPEVFVLGDMAAMGTQGTQTAPLTAQAAFQAAPVVAHNVVAAMVNDGLEGAMVEGRPSEAMAKRPLQPFVYHHLGNMLTLGQGSAVVCGSGLTLTGPIGAFARRWVYWFRMPTWSHRLRVLREAVPYRGKRKKAALRHPPTPTNPLLFPRK